jgi:NADH dehydrogenase
MRAERHRVVVVGAGFGGMAVVKGLAGAGAEITFVDRRNHHLFQPLLYQAATSILPPSQIAWPVRQLLRGRRDVTCLLGEVEGVSLIAHEVALAGGAFIPYDTLVLATGSAHAYFGHDSWAAYAPGLKTLDDATRIRRAILAAFERAEAGGDPAVLLTFVIVGAGPTGVELAGTIAELANTHLPAEFRRIDTRRARIVLIEAGERILPTFDPALAAYAHRALNELGVIVRTGEAVTDCGPGRVGTSSGPIAAGTVIWAAGVAASPAAGWLGRKGDRAGRLAVSADLSVPGHPEVFVIGDTAAVAWLGHGLVPGLAPAAKQQGAFVARVILARLQGRSPPAAFRYRHEGSLATIGRNRAIIDFGRIKLTGPLAWWLWGAAHIYFLITARSRLAVTWNWLWAYVRNEPAARLITGEDASGRGPG